MDRCKHEREKTWIRNPLGETMESGIIQNGLRGCPLSPAAALKIRTAGKK